MKEQFQIWVDRLKTGQTQKIKESFDPAFLAIDEDDLVFEKNVEVTGEAYLSEEELILRLTIAAKAKIPCSICNTMTEFDLSIRDFYHAEPIAQIPSAIFSFEGPLREAILIEIPQYTECHQGKCPSRPSITPYLRSGEKKTENTHFPFSNLDA